MKKTGRMLPVLLVVLLGLVWAYVGDRRTESDGSEPTASVQSVDSAVSDAKETADGGPGAGADLLDAVLALPYSGEPCCEINGNVPFFTESEIGTDEFEKYTELDGLGRCGPAFANISPETLPKEERGAIGQVKPSGWHLVKYDCVEGNYLYNRCHLIAFELAGENANERNLITGTRYLNVEGMLPFENRVASYVKQTGNHVLYRVTPVFAENELVARGVLMEAYSVEDEGEGIRFCVYAFNVQPGIEISYSDGESRLAPEDSFGFPDAEESAPSGGVEEDGQTVYFLNTNTKKFHKESCESVRDIRDENKEMFVGSRQEVIDRGYEPCGRCKP